MRRIYEDSAYDADVPSYWATTIAPEHWPELQGVQKADVAIIGGGFTGLNAALTLAQAGVDVAVVEAQTPGWGASGRNGGFCCLGGTKLPEALMRKRYGDTGLSEWQHTQKASIAYVQALLEMHQIDADTHSKGETQVAHSARAWRAMQDEAEDTAQSYGVATQLTQKADLAAEGMDGPWHGALTTRAGFALNPLKYHTGLVHLAQQAGIACYGQSPVLKMDPHYVLHTPKGKLIADTVIIATNGYSSEDLPEWLRARYLPVQSSVIVTRVLTEKEKAAAGWFSDQMAYDSRQLLHYFRLLPEGRFLFGMRGGLRATSGAQARIKRKIRRDFAKMFPAWRDVDITHDWNGLVCMMPGLVPFAGAIPGHSGLYAGLGYHGNGVALSSFTGHMIARQVLGDPGLPDLMRKPPGRFPLGRARRMLLAPAYLAAETFDL